MGITANVDELFDNSDLDLLALNDTFNIEASIIGSILIDPRCLGEVLSLVKEEDFAYDSMRNIFRAAHELFNKGETVDPITISHRLRGDENKTMAACMRVTPTAANAGDYCKMLLERSELREFRDMAARIRAARSLEEAQAVFSEFLKYTAGRSRWKRTEIRDALCSLLDRLGDDTPPSFIRWGMPVLDDHLQVKADKGKFIVIGAESSVGKTAFALQLAFSMAGTGKRVAFYSLETDEETAYDRVFVNRARIKLNDLQNKRITEPEMQRLVELGAALSDRPQIRLDIIECAGASSAEIRTDILVNRYDVVLIDYIQLMRAQGENRTAIVTNLSIELATMARELGVVVVGLSQLTAPQGEKRNPYRLNRKENLRESQQLVNDADVIMIMSRTREEEPDFREIVIDKNKEGPTGVVQMDFQPEYMTFVPHQNTPREQYNNVMKNAPKPKKEYKNYTFYDLPDGGTEDLPFPVDA